MELVLAGPCMTRLVSVDPYGQLSKEGALCVQDSKDATPC